jgi:hypothetical protein
MTSRRAQPKPITTRIERVRLADLELLELNARFMRHETFRQLVENVKRDGGLTSVPFAAWQKESGKYRVLSGNHRVRAAIEAGFEEADVMLTDDKLSHDREVALQLAHNAIAGEDDPAVLKQLYESLEEIDWRAYSGLDDATLELFEKIDVGQLSEAPLEWTSLALMFLPDELESVEEVFASARDLVVQDKKWLVRWGQYDALLDELATAAAAHGVSNQAAALDVVLAIVRKHRHEFAAGWLDEDGELVHKGSVPIASVLGSDRIPAKVAALLKKRLDPIAGRNEIPPAEMWRALEKLLTDAG